jgi:SAM-dependent methyltransferase
MHVKYKTRCRVCKCESLKPVIDLNAQYLQGSFVKPGTMPPPLRQLPTTLVRCDVSTSENACGLLQLQHSIPPEILYANYWYRSGTNETMRGHLRGIVDSLLEIYGATPARALDIGCNDGTLLKCYPKGVELWGFDPSDIAQEIVDWVEVVGTTFPSARGRARLAGRKFDLITSIAMFYDLEDPVAFATEIRDILAPDGIWTIEMSYMPLMLKMNSFDTICHEHLEYYSLDALQYVANAAGLRIFRTELNGINGGSIRCYICHQECLKYDTRASEQEIRRLQMMEFQMQLDTDVPYRAFQQRIERLRDQMGELLTEIHTQGKKVHIYGASTKGNVLLQWYNIDGFKIEFAADRNPQKHGARTLGTNIKIISEEESRAMRPDYYLVLPWHFRKEFLAREAETIRNGTKMLFPLPEIEVVDESNLDARLNEPDVTARGWGQLLGI